LKKKKNYQICKLVTPTESGNTVNLKSNEKILIIKKSVSAENYFSETKNGLQKPTFGNFFETHDWVSWWLAFFCEKHSGAQRVNYYAIGIINY